MLKKLAVMMALMLALGSTSFAQTLKLGYVNSLEVLSKMPQMAGADKQLEAYALEKEKAFGTLYTEYERKVQEYSTTLETMSASMKQMAEEELVAMQERLGKQEQKIQADITAEREKLYAPIISKVDEAIKSVATKNGYNFIFDSSAGAILFANESDHVLSLVLAELGIAN